MRAVVRDGKALKIKEMAAPEPGAGQVLARSLTCGICGGDLHALTDMDHFSELARRANLPFGADPNKDIVLGHEFCAEILDHGPATDRRFKPGTRVISLPYAAGPGGIELIGLSNTFPGGFAEQMVLTESLLFEVPNGLSDEHATLVEPMAVGEHAVAATPGLKPGQPVLVLGCGPVGIAVLLALKRRGLGPIVAADFSPERRAFAERAGADEVVDPAERSPHDCWAALAGGAAGDMTPTLSPAMFRPGRRAIAFDCVGAAGMLQKLIEDMPPHGQIIAVGACSRPDRIEPMMALTKHLSVLFNSSYSAEEFGETLFNVAHGVLDIAPLVTSVVDMSGVAGAFDRLINDKTDMKIVVDMRRAIQRVTLPHPF